MYQYKLRAECISDIRSLKRILKKNSINIYNDSIQYNSINCPTYTMTTNVSLDIIKDFIEDMDDTHVMLETIAPIDKYSGERN